MESNTLVEMPHSWEWNRVLILLFSHFALLLPSPLLFYKALFRINNFCMYVGTACFLASALGSCVSA